MVEVGARWRVEGEVQGVGYRAFVVRAAEAAGVVGWVRNEPDGAVAVEAWGSPSALGELERALQRGPRWSRVAEVARREVEGGPDALRFRVRF